MTIRDLYVVVALALVVFLAACTSGSDDGLLDGDASDGDIDGDEADGDVPDGDLVDGDVADGDVADGDVPDGDLDVDDDAEAEAPGGLPMSLAIDYSRADVGTPLTDEEITTFTKKVMGFFKKIHYFDYLLYTTHGVDASTGMKDWQFWYNERFRKDGDTVTFYMPENLTDGGHNLHIPLSRALGDTLAAVMVTGDDTATLAATQMCKGFSASMLGMVHDDADDLPHLMTRNVVPGFNQSYTTHDGKKIAVDFSGWWSSYPRWNCSRYHVTENPYWGDVWVTNLRSKDDVPHIFRLVPVLRYAVETIEDDNLHEACGETLDLLEAFAKDIVESDYRIRTKDENGDIMIPGFTDDEELNKQQGDLASFIHYRDFIPEGECNARRGSELIGYHTAINEDCGRGEPNAYDSVAYTINRYNKRICRYFHLAHVANALVNGDNEAAVQLLDGLDERMTMEQSAEEDDIQYELEDWYRNLALYYAQSHSFGFPLTSEEARAIHHYYLKGIEHMLAWPYWDPWADSVPDGELGGYRPPNCATIDDQVECWWRVEDLAQIFENCWSPLVNPDSARWVDCDIVRDPSQWDESVWPDGDEDGDADGDAELEIDGDIEIEAELDGDIEVEAEIDGDAEVEIDGDIEIEAEVEAEVDGDVDIESDDEQETEAA